MVDGCCKMNDTLGGFLMMRFRVFWGVKILKSVMRFAFSVER